MFDRDCRVAYCLFELGKVVDFDSGENQRKGRTIHQLCRRAPPSIRDFIVLRGVICTWMVRGVRSTKATSRYAGAFATRGTLIRQALQHPSNENTVILEKTTAYKWVFASDATPPNEIPRPNDDMVDGFVVRERGLFLEQPPFNKKCECLLITSIQKQSDHGIFENIRTMFIENTTA
jgi:hypothetical protein